MTTNYKRYKQSLRAEKRAYETKRLAYRAWAENAIENLEAGLEQAYRDAHAAWDKTSREASEAFRATL